MVDKRSEHFQSLQRYAVVLCSLISGKLPANLQYVIATFPQIVAIARLQINTYTCKTI